MKTEIIYSLICLSLFIIGTICAAKHRKAALKGEMRFASPTRRIKHKFWKGLIIIGLIGFVGMIYLALSTKDSFMQLINVISLIIMCVTYLLFWLDFLVKGMKGEI